MDVSTFCCLLLQVFACGFESGAVRVFHVANTCLLSEHSIHSSVVTGIVFAPSGEYLYSGEVKGNDIFGILEFYMAQLIFYVFW